jgi:signal transduction histidine kinase
MSYARDYATPTRLLIRLDMTGDRIKITVEDDGRHFDAEQIFSASTDYHSDDARVQGLITLKEKFELVNGTMTVTSDEAHGTIVKLELPTEA